MSDCNPFEPEETREQRMKRVSGMIRENVDRRLEMKPSAGAMRIAYNIAQQHAHDAAQLKVPPLVDAEVRPLVEALESLLTIGGSLTETRVRERYDLAIKAACAALKAWKGEGE